MKTFDVVGFVERVIMSILDFGQVLMDFMSLSIHIPFTNIYFSMWSLLAGIGFVALLIWKLFR